MIMLIACLTGYLAVLIIDVNQGASIIVTSYVNVDGVRPPSNKEWNVNVLIINYEITLLIQIWFFIIIIDLHFSGVYNASITGCAEAHSKSFKKKVAIS